MQNVKTRRIKRRLFGPLLLIALAMSGILALAYYGSFQVVNQFPVDFLSVNMRETFDPPEHWDGGMVVKKVTYLNQGTKDALLRVHYGESFTDEKGMVLSSKLQTESGELQEVVDKKWGAQGLTAGWTEKNGWYYYNRVMKPGDEITVLEGVQYHQGLVIPEAYKSAVYELTFIHEYINAEKKDAALWGTSDYQADASGNIRWGF